MPTFTLSDSDDLQEPEVLSLYDSVGWTAYTRETGTLMRGIRNSSFVVTARDRGGALVGLARAVSDDATICYLQDILVLPDSQGCGVGRMLLERVTQRYAHVRQSVLLTDDEPGQRAFYQALGFTEGRDFSPEPLRVFARIA